MNKRFLFSLDYGLIVPAIVLVTLSLTTLFSINIALFKNQLIFFIISILALIFFSQVNYKILKKYCGLIYVTSIVLFILVLVIGVESRGSVRWFEIMGFRIQFSEILKPFLAISFSAYLANRENHSYKTFFLIICFLAPIAVLILVQPDLGNALIYILVTVLTLFIYGFPLPLFLLSSILVSIVAPFLWQFMHQYQKQRIITFFHPTDPLGFSYNAIQSIITIGSGMIVGKGLGQGTQSGLQFLPERHTDFIFATLSEGLGFIGGVIVLLSFSFLLYRIIIIFSNAQDSFFKLFAITVFSLILLQFFINIGMNIGVIPVVGVTLPFISYGGSSLLSNFIILGILSAISQDPTKRKVLEIN
ncbi:MAG: FtsW/RodA/SpoVE family cell cycle protein [Patescibacteria group bacterium]